MSEINVMRSAKTPMEIAERAQQELGYAEKALQQAGALFAAIEKAFLEGDKDSPFLLAQIGIETTGYQAERAGSEAEFFGGARHV
jgi:hypothetical protein